MVKDEQGVRLRIYLKNGNIVESEIDEDYERFTLHYFLKRIKKKKWLYLGDKTAIKVKSIEMIRWIDLSK